MSNSPSSLSWPNINQSPNVQSRRSSNTSWWPGWFRILLLGIWFLGGVGYFVIFNEKDAQFLDQELMDVPRAAILTKSVDVPHENPSIATTKEEKLPITVLKPFLPLENDNHPAIPDDISSTSTTTNQDNISNSSYNNLTPFKMPTSASKLEEIDMTGGPSQHKGIDDLGQNSNKNATEQTVLGLDATSPKKAISASSSTIHSFNETNKLQANDTIESSFNRRRKFDSSSPEPIRSQVMLKTVNEDNKTTDDEFMIQQDKIRTNHSRKENTTKFSTSMMGATLNQTMPSQPLDKPGPKIVGTATTVNGSSPHEIQDFERQEGVVIVTKLHGPHQLLLLDQSLCLLHYAYNIRMLYDIIVFTTEPIPESDVENTRRLVAPAKLTVVVDNRGLQEEIAALSRKRYAKFLKSCKVTSPVNLTWWSECPGRIAYNWQAEFRSLHIWKRTELAPYKYMLWMDTDGFCTKPWEKDPVATMIRNDLVILFDNFPQGKHQGPDVQRRIFDSFNTTICRLSLKDGHLNAELGPDCYGSRVKDIHGFFHITNLDFYRSDQVQFWAKTWIGNCFLCRNYDDQCAVTVPAAILAPERAWDMRSNGLKLDVLHNYYIDGKRAEFAGRFKKYWKKVAKQQMKEADGKCPLKAQA